MLFSLKLTDGDDDENKNKEKNNLFVLLLFVPSQQLWSWQDGRRRIKT